MMTGEWPSELSCDRDRFQVKFDRTGREHRSERRCRAHPMSSIFPCVASDYAPQNYQSQRHKNQAEEYPTDQKFPYVVGIQTKSEKQPRELRHTMVFLELFQRVLCPARLVL